MRLGLILIWPLLCAGCIGLFRPATPQAPTGSLGSDVDLNYRDPSSVLATMASGMAAKGLRNGLAAYAGAFADSVTDGVPFHAIFDPEVARRREQANGRVPTWTLSLEKNFYAYFVGLRSDGYYLRWTHNDPGGDDDINLITGNAVLHEKYEVFIVSSENAPLGRIAVGLADLTLKQVSENRWAIVLWDDRVDPTVGVNPADPDQLSFSARRLETQ